MNFYHKTLKKILSDAVISTSDKILVVAGGKRDRDTLLKLGFAEVTITNLDYDRGVKNYDPFEWKREDVENLSYENNSFDWVFVHAGLHHCASPHRGLCEMLRVAKKGVCVFESRDSWLNKLANTFGLAPSYEIEPCALSNGVNGGVRNSHIPNYVYKWTENEVRKTVNSFIPEYKHRFLFFYGLAVPTERLAISKSRAKKIMATIGKVVLPVATFFLKKQGNLFAFVVIKNVELQPWLKMNNNEIIFDLEYSKSKFNPEEYSESI